MRHDVLIIWGHGLPDLDGVLDIVRTTPDFNIRRILVRDIDDMPRFVRSVYNFDYAPYRHLIDKTKYLISVPPQAAFIFIDNLHPEEHTVGQGRFAHTECKKMTALKRAIRDQYNPTINGKPGEHHIVHGTDHVGQTLATLKLLSFRSIDELTQAEPAILPTPSHLPPRKQWTFKQIDLSKVYARIANPPGHPTPHTVLPLSQTPHALYLTGETEAYETYWQTHRGTKLQDDHAPQAFKQLSEQLDYLGPDHPDSYLLLEPLDDERYILLDGVHRASILLTQNQQHIIAAVADLDTNEATPSAAPRPDLLQVFDQTLSHDFAVMKSLPEGTPEPGSDIDLLCSDKTELGRQLLRNCRPLIDKGVTLRLRDKADTNQSHLDILHGDKIALRLDLHQGLGVYQNVLVKPTFAQRLLDRRTHTTLTCPQGDLRLPVPGELDNLVLRYLEYHEWFEARPDKIKHAEHLAAAFADDPAKAKAFYQRLLQATPQRPTTPALQHCDLNLKRQCIWAYWSLRDKLAWRLRSARNLAVMALTQPGVFTHKLIARLTP